MAAEEEPEEVSQASWEDVTTKIKEIRCLRLHFRQTAAKIERQGRYKKEVTDAFSQGFEEDREFVKEMAPRWPQDGPRWPQTAPGHRKMAPRWPQEGP